MKWNISPVMENTLLFVQNYLSKEVIKELFFIFSFFFNMDVETFVSMIRLLLGEKKSNNEIQRQADMSKGRSHRG